MSASPYAALADNYDALCGTANCTLTVTPQSVSTGYISIPTERITYWGNIGDTKTSVGTGVATTIVFGPIGLLGFLAKNHEYNFTINGYDSEGKKASIQVQFKNDKPAKRLMNELVGVTGLAMNQTRTADEILASEKVDKNLSDLEKAKSAPKLGQLESKNAPVSANKNCWSTYLANNPAVRKWAEANPAQSEQNQKKFDKC